VHITPKMNDIIEVTSVIIVVILNLKKVKTYERDANRTIPPRPIKTRNELKPPPKKPSIVPKKVIRIKVLRPAKLVKW